MNELKIPSFEKDHNTITQGVTVSGKDGGLTTYDLRFIKPNGKRYISPAAIHSIEHIVAALLRNGGNKQDIVYFGPMGCRTGFYLITRNLSLAAVKKLLAQCIADAQNMNSVPGATKSECGNYKEHNLNAAKKHLKNFSKYIF